MVNTYKVRSWHNGYMADVAVAAFYPTSWQHLTMPSQSLRSTRTMQKVTWQPELLQVAMKCLLLVLCAQQVACIMLCKPGRGSCKFIVLPCVVWVKRRDSV